MDIYADGAINHNTYKEVIRAGTSILVLGSDFFKTEDPGTFIKDIRNYSNRLSIL